MALSGFDWQALLPAGWTAEGYTAREDLIVIGAPEKKGYVTLSVEERAFCPGMCAHVRKGRMFTVELAQPKGRGWREAAVEQIVTYLLGILS